MSTFWKWGLAAGAVLALGMIWLFLTVWFLRSDAMVEHRARDAAIRPLLERHATRDEVVQALGLQFVDYSRDSTNRWVIEQRVSETKVRQLADRHPGVLFHTTMDWKTWLFFDAEGRLQDYVLSPQ